MGRVSVRIAGRDHVLACRDGEEPRVSYLAAEVDARVSAAAGAGGGQSEARQLLLAALMLADELDETRHAAATEAELIGIVETFASRIEGLADGLEAGTDTP